MKSFSKSDLRTGMLVTLRNGESYYVMLNACPSFLNQEDLLVHKVGDDTGWMPLCDYSEDMTYHDSQDSDIVPVDPDDDPNWDIMQVDTCTSAAYLFRSHRYTTVWKREE